MATPRHARDSGLDTEMPVEDPDGSLADLFAHHAQPSRQRYIPLLNGLTVCWETGMVCRDSDGKPVETNLEWLIIRGQVEQRPDGSWVWRR